MVASGENRVRISMHYLSMRLPAPELKVQFVELIPYSEAPKYF